MNRPRLRDATALVPIETPSRFEAHIQNAVELARLQLASAMSKEACDTAARAQALFATGTGLNPRDRAAPTQEALKSARAAWTTLGTLLEAFEN